MRALRNLSLKRKLTLISMLASGAALLLACLIFVTCERVVFRRSMVRDLSITAQMVADNVSAEVAFDDYRTAKQTLSSLRAQPHIMWACLYTLNGEVFAKYERGDLAGRFTPPPPSPENHHQFGPNRLEVFQEIRLPAQRVGTLYIASDLGQLRARLWYFALIVCLALPGSSLAAFLLSARLQRIISEPMLRLAGIATRVAQEKNYSLRAERVGENELGRLIDGFNHMLAQIQERDAALQAARDNLEERVEQRTRDLQQANEERRKTAEALLKSDALYHSLVEHLPAGVFRKDREGRFVFVNSRFCRIKGLTQEQILGKTPQELVATQAAMLDPESSEMRLQAAFAGQGADHHQQILRNGRPIEVEEQYRAADGSVQHLHVVKSPVFGPDGAIVGSQGMLLDITSLKQAEAKLEATHKQLVEISRQAGMAEVATSVLHNVGNVLNSINTSANVVSDILRQSRSSGIHKAAELLEKHRHAPADFFADGSRMTKLIVYLRALERHLADEQAKVLAELHGLCVNIEHVNRIVAMQQSYAKVCGVIEMHSLPALVEDALRIHAGALARDQVAVLREFDPVPELPLDKHKLLQILVNLISNARYALSASPTPDRRLILGVALTGEDRVRVWVADNGVGIPPENLTRIFSHGFTTRPEGHGFGLHSGALAAREMGGSLLVQSEGLGRGATFVLELPVNPKSPPAG